MSEARFDIKIVFEKQTSIYENRDFSTILDQLLSSNQDVFYCSNVNLSSLSSSKQIFGYASNNDDYLGFIEIMREDANSCTKIINSFGQLFQRMRQEYLAKNKNISKVLLDYCNHYIQDSGPLIIPANKNNAVIVKYRADHELQDVLTDILKAQLMRHYGIVFVVKDITPLKGKILPCQIFPWGYVKKLCGMYNGLQQKHSALMQENSELTQKNAEVAQDYSKLYDAYENLLERFEEYHQKFKEMSDYLRNLDRHNEFMSVYDKFEEVKNKITKLIENHSNN